jgi:hypothetical protein
LKDSRPSLKLSHYTDFYKYDDDNDDDDYDDDNNNNNNERSTGHDVVPADVGLIPR